MIRPDGSADLCTYWVRFTPLSPGPKLVTETVFGLNNGGVAPPAVFQWAGTGISDESKHRLVIEFTGAPSSGSPNEIQTVSMLPSIEGCGQLNPRQPEKEFKITCVNTETGEKIAGCRYQARMQLGENDGGHTHNGDSRPLGVSSLEESGPIPINGLEALYLSPEVGGDVELLITGTDPDNRNIPESKVIFEIKEGDFVPLGNSGLFFDVQSHPSGDRGTNEMRNRMMTLVQRFEAQVRSESGYVINIPMLESEGGSLPRGGLFDYDYQAGNAWTPPHCGHRDGKTIDISYSVFDGYTDETREFLLKAINKAFGEARLNSVLEESRNSKHWHVRLR